MLLPSIGFTAPLKSSLSLLALLAGLAPICRSAAVAPQATPVDSLHVADGFKVELLYSVPKDQQGSWVAMTVDPKGTKDGDPAANAPPFPRAALDTYPFFVAKLLFVILDVLVLRKVRGRFFSFLYS